MQRQQQGWGAGPGVVEVGCRSWKGRERSQGCVVSTLWKGSWERPHGQQEAQSSQVLEAVRRKMRERDLGRKNK